MVGAVPNMVNDRWMNVDWCVIGLNGTVVFNRDGVNLLVFNRDGVYLLVFNRVGVYLLVFNRDGVNLLGMNDVNLGGLDRQNNRRITLSIDCCTRPHHCIHRG